MNKKTQVIIAAGGSGVRMQDPTPKPLLPLRGRPLLEYSLQVFAACPAVAGMIVVAAADQMDACGRVVAAARIAKPVRLAVGGDTRRDSVRQGLAALDGDTQYVLIHDAARPLLSSSVVDEVLRVCYDNQAVIPAVPVKATIKRVAGGRQQISATLDRSELFEAQTPQAFRRDLIERAHAQALDEPATDDASLVERLGEPVWVVMGDYRNIKITTPEDLVIAAALLA